ncbi:akirin-2-like [Actinia tenebrosa]|uniref:Akirin-2-like n=1 Tax=Actinia tenebrosa TaxID=6105 RepID=A0A6P8HDB0_ACTTE|nr:akirin-2-like [Actinia tenebrosa]
MACATLKRSFEFDPLLSPQHQPSPKRRRCVPMSTSTSCQSPSQSSKESPFTDVTPRITQEQLSTNIHLEWKRLQRRKHLKAPTCNSVEAMNTVLSSPGSSPTRKDQPLFTLKQVSLICERLLKERDTQLKEQYDKVLNTKLSEQYDAFVKFNYDQVQRRFEKTAPTYVS